MSESSFFFFNDPATPEIYTLSLHDALPISCAANTTAGTCRVVPCTRRIRPGQPAGHLHPGVRQVQEHFPGEKDRKSTRLNSSHPSISYAVFCLKKKKNAKRS